VLGALAIVAGFEAARLFWDVRTALCGALVAMLAFPMFYYARTGNVDVPLLSLLALQTAALARFVRLGPTRARAAWLGAFAGAAVATKEAAAGVALGMAAALLWTGLRAGGERSRRCWAAGVAAALGVYAVASGALLDARWWLRHLGELSGRLDDVATGAHATVTVFPLTLSGHLGLLRANAGFLADSLGGPGFALALAGLVYALVAERHRAGLAWPLAGYLAFLFVSLRVGELRYMLPAAFFLAWFAGRAVTRALETRSRLVGVVACAAFAAALATGALRGLALTWEMLHDSRYAAAAWLAERTGPGDTVEYFGASQTLPPLEAGVVSAPSTAYAGMYVAPRVDGAKVEEIRAGWAQRRPRFLIVVPDHTSAPGREHSFTLPPQLFDSLVAGREALRPVAEFRTPPLFPWLSRPALDYPTVNPPVRVFAP
jgi:hypothetical protein